MAKKKFGREKVKWTKEMQMVKDMESAGSKLSEEEREFGLKMAGIMKWNKWTLILIVAGVVIGMIGQMQNIQWAYYAAIVVWGLAMACSYKFTKERNDIVLERELKRKEEKEKKKLEESNE